MDLHNSDEEAIYTIEPTRMRTDPLYIRVYILWMNLIVQIVVPFALLVFLNIKIFQRVKQLEAREAIQFWLKFRLEKRIDTPFDSETCLNYPILNIFSV